MECGLLGGKLGHSFSPQIHGALADYRYTLCEKTPEELNDFLKNGDFTGLNVTIPYKKTVIPYCAELSDQARKIGAVNTIVRRPDGTLLGHNTDYFGFAYLLRQSGIAVAGKKCLVLGTGGVSVTVQAVLREQGAQVVVLSRSGPENYDHLERHADAALIVNATPVGMYPNTGVSPVDLKCFPKLEGGLDLIYNPARTQFLLDAEKLGVPGWNGLSMLVAQAKESAAKRAAAPVDDPVGQTVIECAAEAYGVDKETISLDTDIREDLSNESMKMIVMISEIEERLQVTIEIQEASLLNTIGEFVAKVKERL